VGYFGSALSGATLAFVFAATQSTTGIPSGTSLTGTITGVPEPSTLVSGAIGAVAFVAYGWSRHRREQRRQAAA
jgi:hypothetical protein